jgi:glyoxylase-like metal-dependent hydrolase (beta-lactamase superfamily II)
MSQGASAPNIFFKQLELGPMQNFVYLLGDPATRSLAVVDPAWEIETILDEARRHDMEITHLLVTHFHPDHLGGRMMGMSVRGAAELLAAGVKAKVHIHKAEAPYVHRVSDLSASDLHAVESGDVVNVGRLPVKFIHTPGHTPGSQCFLVGDSLVSGDTLFIGSCGRVDLPGSDPRQLYESLKRLGALPEATRLYPGHNYASAPSSTIGEQKRRNPFMRFDDVQEFLAMMGYG